ncbi:MAG: Hin recombinase [Deltaproteobacteria bacterium]|nr:Hin recombinase [Deltaproteobacteria bacterium]
MGRYVCRAGRLLSGGAKLGRPRALTPEQLEMARTLMANPNLSARQVARQPGVHRAALYRNLAGR